MNESFPTITAAIAEDRLADGKPSVAFAEGRKVYAAYKWPLAKAFDELRKRAKILANG